MTRVLFVCVHNAGRSQMAEAILNRMASERDLPFRATSAGTVGGKTINPVALAVMDEIGISMTGQSPKLLTQAMADEADLIVTMGVALTLKLVPLSSLSARTGVWMILLGSQRKSFGAFVTRFAIGSHYYLAALD